MGRTEGKSRDAFLLFVSLASIIALASLKNTEGAVIVGVCSVAFVLVLNLKELSYIKFGLLEARLRNAEEGLLTAEQGTALVLEMLLSLLTYHNRMGGMPSEIRSKLFDELNDHIQSSSRIGELLASPVDKYRKLIRWDHLVSMKQVLPHFPSSCDYKSSLLQNMLNINVDEELPTAEELELGLRDYLSDFNHEREPHKLTARQMIEEYKQALKSDSPVPPLWK